MPAQAFHRVSDLLVSGTDAALRSLQGYTSRAWLLAAWQDVFVDRVQGQLQQLFLSLLARAQSGNCLRHGPHCWLLHTARLVNILVVSGQLLHLRLLLLMRACLR